MSAVYCQVKVSASGRTLVQRSPTECGVANKSDREAPYGEARNRVEEPKRGKSHWFKNRRNPPCKNETYSWSYRSCSTASRQQETIIHAPAGFEPAIPASEWPQTHALLDRTATGISFFLAFSSHKCSSVHNTVSCLCNHTSKTLPSITVDVSKSTTVEY